MKFDREKMLAKWQEKARLVDRALEELLPPPDREPAVIHQAMRYSLFAGGKRIRPVLTLAAAEVAGGNWRDALPAACALEMIHTYSLIHDDLPAMDNDDFRRGKPTCHRVYGEAMAILAGDALLTLAFQVLAEAATGKEAQRYIQVIAEIAAAAGTAGMVGGQVMDLQAENQVIDGTTMAKIHSLKTGALIRAAVRSGALLAGAEEDVLQVLTVYAEKFGLAFQITDDILDEVGEAAKMGKNPGSDRRKQKATYLSLYGLEVAREKAREAVEEAVAVLKPLGEKGEFLRFLACYLLERES